MCVRACVRIDFPTRLFTAEVKLWLEREERGRERERRREKIYIWPSGEPARTHTRKHTEAQYYFLVLFYSHSPVTSDTSPTNIPTTAAHTPTEHMRRRRDGSGQTYQRADGQTDRLPPKQPQWLFNSRPPKKPPPLTKKKNKKRNHNVGGFRVWVTRTQTNAHTLSWPHYKRNPDLITAEVWRSHLLATKNLSSAQQSAETDTAAPNAQFTNVTSTWRRESAPTRGP